MSDSSPNTDAAASTCVHDIVFAEDEEALSWRCEELVPTGPFGSQKDAVAAVKQYSVRQGFAVSIYRSKKMAPSAFFCAVHRESTTSDHMTGLCHCKIVQLKRSGACMSLQSYMTNMLQKKPPVRRFL